MENVSLVDGHIDNGMSDEDIIKALECCKYSVNNKDCENCPYVECETMTGCVGELLEDALDLINRQKAEIERLEFSNEHLMVLYIILTTL